MKTHRIGDVDRRQVRATVKPVLSQNVPSLPLGSDRQNHRFTPDEDDEAISLLAAARGGDEAAFERLATELRPFTRRICGGWFYNPADADDAVQDTWLQIWLWTQKPDAPMPATAIGLVARFAGWTCQNIVSARRALKRGGREPRLHDAEIRACLYRQHGHRHGQSTIEQTERAPEGDPLQKMGIVHRLVGKLPAEHIATLNRFFFDCRSVEEIAEERAQKKADIHRLLASGIEMIRLFADRLAGDGGDWPQHGLEVLA